MNAQAELFEDDAAHERARLIRGVRAPRAKARRTDPETSHEAAKSVSELRVKQQAVLSVLRRNGQLTDEGIALWYPDASGDSNYPPQSPSGLRTRRDELVKAGLVRFAGRWEKTKSNRRTRVWEVAK